MNFDKITSAQITGLLLGIAEALGDKDDKGKLTKPITDSKMVDEVLTPHQQQIRAAKEIWCVDDISFMHYLLKYSQLTSRIIFTCGVEHEKMIRAVLRRSSDFDRGRQDDGMPIGVKLLCYNDVSELTILKAENMQFDIIAGNPPYKRGMHLDFLRLSLEVLKDEGELIFVHPAEWLVQKRNTRNNKSTYAPLRLELSKFHTEIKLISNPWPDVGLYVPLSITHVSPGNGCGFTDARAFGYGGMTIMPKARVELKSLDEVTQWGDPKHVTSLLKKVWKHPDRWHDKARTGSGKWYVNLSGITGNGKTTHTYYDGKSRTVYNMYSLVNSTSLEITETPQHARAQAGKEKGNEKVWVPFASKEEAQNALDFVTKTRFVKALIALSKIDQHIWSGRLLDSLPWLDWNLVWTDEELAKFFNLTAEEQQTITNIVDAITL